MIAFLHGGRVEVDWRPIMMKRLTVTGSTLRASPLERKAAIARVAAREGLAAARERRSEAGRPPRRSRWPRPPRAHALMESSQHIGKIMLAVRP